MKKLNYIFALVGWSLMIASCSAAKIISGYYGNGASNFIILNSNGTFEYEYRGVLWGDHSWSYGKWAKISDDKLLLRSFTHDSIPFIVAEGFDTLDNKVFVMPKKDIAWLTDAFIVINGIPFRITEGNTMVILPAEEFPLINSISIKAKIPDGDLLNEMVNHNEINTITYSVTDKTHNIFHITFPERGQINDFNSNFYLREFNDTIVIKNNKLLWRGYKYPKAIPKIVF